jgi:hypothetical protein
MYFLYSRCVVLFSEMPYVHFLYPVLHKFLHHTFFYLNLGYFNVLFLFVFLDHFKMLMSKKI